MAAPSWTKPDFVARYGPGPGQLVLDVRAVARHAAYQWQMSSDGASWVDLPATLECTTTVSGLVPASVYFFRFRTLTKAGMSDWSNVLRVIAH
jgi:hypothetical protein